MSFEKLFENASKIAHLLDYLLYAFGNFVFFWKHKVCWSRFGKVTYVKRIGLLKLSQRYAFINEKLY